MKRSTFIKSIGLGSVVSPYFLKQNPATKEPFTMHFAPHLGMFKELAGSSIVDQIQFMADEGFTAFEDNEFKQRPKKDQLDIINTLQKNKMKMGVFVAHTIQWNQPDLVSSDKENRRRFLQEIEESIDVAKEVNAQWMTVVPGHVDPRLAMEYQTANAIENLNYAAELLEPHNLTVVLEPLNFRDHPGLFLTESPQAYQICKAINSPSVKILFDIYHQQIQEGNLIPNIEASWDEIAYFQIGDNPGRNEPTTGEIHYQNVFKYIYEKGYQGILGMEHRNSISGKEGERAVINAYRACNP